MTGPRAIRSKAAECGAQRFGLLVLTALLLTAVLAVWPDGPRAAAGEPGPRAIGAEVARRGAPPEKATMNRHVRRVLRVAGDQPNHGGHIDDRPRAFRVRLATVGAPAPALRRVVRTARRHGVTVRLIRSRYTERQLLAETAVAAMHRDVLSCWPDPLGRSLRIGVSPHSRLLELTQSQVRAELRVVVRVSLAAGTAVPAEPSIDRG